MTARGDWVETELLGVRVHATSVARAVDFVAERVEAREATFVVNANVYSVLLASELPALHHCFREAGMVNADGMPIVWSLHKLGLAAERVHGDDLMLQLCERHRRWRHFLLGGRSGQPERVAAALATRFPGIEVAGVHATPVRPPPRDENARILAAIDAARADIVWVGMGTPQQDLWMRENRQAVGRPMIGVGSAFDLLAGRTRATPEWMKAAGLQWAHRVAQEPRRLFARYARTNPRFIARIVPELVRRRLGT